MTSLVVWMVLVVAAALVVLAVVAVPRLREGRPLLTRDGRERVEQARRAAAERAREARRRAAELAAQAAERARPAEAPRTRPTEQRADVARTGAAAAHEQVVDLRAVESTASTAPSARPAPGGHPHAPGGRRHEAAPGPRHARS